MGATPYAGFAERLDLLVDWLYPPRCRGCGGRIFGRDAECFCAACWQLIRLLAHPLCDICGRPFPDASGADHVCGGCLSRPPEFTQARAWACYPRQETAEHPLRHAIQRFKYGRKVSLGKPLGRVLAQGCRLLLAEWKVDVIIPVPLHPKRLRWRGFNQSVLLGRELSRVFDLPLDPFLLERKVETPPQTQLSEEERRGNVRGAFFVNPEKSVENRSVLLLDDVYTSGATVNECSRCLKRAGAKEVYVLTLARAVS
jgi:ComF family protein